MSVVAVSFLIYTLGIAALGIWSVRYSRRSEADFLLADRGLGAWVAALSASASAESGWVTLGLVGIAFKTGVGALWIVPGTVAAFIFNWFVLAPRLQKVSRESNALTIPDVLAAPHRALPAMLIRVAGVLIILSMLTAYVAAQLNAAGKTFQGTFDWDYRTGVLVGATIILVYTIAGGFRAIAWTDVVQSIFMISAVTLVPAVLIAKLGGPGEFWNRLDTMEPNGSLTDPLAGKAGLALVGFLALWLGVPLGNPGQPHMLVRLMAVKDRTAIRRGGFISSCWVLVLFTGAVFLGMAARAYYGELDDPERALPTIATDSNLIPGVVGGMLIAAILAAICSTADSQLLVSASAISHDLPVGILGKRLTVVRKMFVDRAAVVLVGAVATAIALAEARSVFSFVLDYGWAGLGAGFGPPLIVSLLWKRTTGWGVLAGMIVGISTAIIWRQFPDLHAQLYNLVPAFLFSLAATYVVSLCTQRTLAPKQELGSENPDQHRVEHPS
ncbi:MAG: sodium/proline symporter [Planctomycetes bacterium]|nr:sodium/proline symporter [Planctomycetota bacterium]MBL7041297.1 sodium/proline symporter [Pirellulaceae bacterium]